MQRRARQWIDVATKNAAASQLRAEKDKAEAEKNQVKSQLEDANRRLAQLEERLLKGK
jgi:predicted  nucleic acid-binding Zn-ribbon protein